MELLSNNVFSVTKGNRAYNFVVPNAAPYGEAIDACFEVLMKLHDMQKEAIEKIKPLAPAAEEAVPETTN
jgi:hypothetical protein